jgi:folate-binding Fe-S cluster repair protein YgfZ
MEYWGKLKRKMFSIFIHEESAPTIGSKLYSASSTSAQGAGEVIAIEKDGDGAWEGLAVIEVSAAEADDVTLSEDGAIPVIIIQ